jgi:NAD(P)-dependent dehydrogenase (short-subunit alcohol dehydrogenase family)
MNINVCVITGSSPGSGAATAILFAERGWVGAILLSCNPRLE